MRRLARLAFCLALWAGPASAQVSSLSPDGQRLVDGWRAELAQLRTSQATAPAANLADEFARRINLEQAGRKWLTSVMLSTLPAEQKRSAEAAIWADLKPIDDDNLRYLKTVLPPDGWFRLSRDGREVSLNAWLIVQHAPDLAFQKQILAHMERLLPEGEVIGGNYALLYDRVALKEGRPQRYGSQATCEQGVMALLPLEDPDGVEARRKALGMKSLDEYKRAVRIGQPC